MNKQQLSNLEKHKALCDGNLKSSFKENADIWRKFFKFELKLNIKNADKIVRNSSHFVGDKKYFQP